MNGQQPYNRPPMPPGGGGYPQQPVRMPPQRQPRQPYPGPLQQPGFQQPMPGQQSQQPQISQAGFSKTKSFFFGMLGFIAIMTLFFLISLVTFYFKYVRK